MCTNARVFCFSPRAYVYDLLLLLLLLLLPLLLLLLLPPPPPPLPPLSRRSRARNENFDDLICCYILLPLFSKSVPPRACDCCARRAMEGGQGVFTRGGQGVFTRARGLVHNTELRTGAEYNRLM